MTNGKTCDIVFKKVKALIIFWGALFAIQGLFLHKGCYYEVRGAKIEEGKGADEGSG